MISDQFQLIVYNQSFKNYFSFRGFFLLQFYYIYIYIYIIINFLND